MAIINLGELNQKILDADKFGIFYTSTYTPPISSLKVVSDTVYLDKIKRLVFSSAKSDNFRISEDLYFVSHLSESCLYVDTYIHTYIHTQTNIHIL